MTTQSWEPHAEGCTCPWCIPPITPKEVDAWANDPDRTTRRETYL